MTGFSDAEDGAKLCDAIHTALERGDKAVLNFEGVTTLVAVFLNTAIGCLYGSFDPNELDRRLHWKGLDETDESVLRMVRQNAIDYYASDEASQSVLVDASGNAVVD